MDVIKSQPRGARVGCHGASHSYSSIAHHCGLSLLETLGVISIISILLGIGIPSWHAFIATNRATSEINALVGSLAMTRSEAVKRGIRVTLCQSSDQVHCDSDGNWSVGWMAFTDNNKNRKLDDGEDIILANRAIPADTKINFNGGFGIDGYIVYKADGTVYPNGTFSVCLDQRPTYNKALILYRTGRLRTEDYSNTSKANCL